MTNQKRNNIFRRTKIYLILGLAVLAVAGVNVGEARAVDCAQSSANTIAQGMGAAVNPADLDNFGALTQVQEAVLADLTVKSQKLCGTCCAAQNPGPVTSLANKCFSDCMAAVAQKNTLLLSSAAWKITKKNDIKQAFRDVAQASLALAFKESLSMFARQVAHDTAVWVASGGRGQKPLFITEGWGAYVEKAGDAALGNFIDGIGKTFGLDLCRPDFRVKLAVQAGLNYKQPRQLRCSFSQMKNNWRSAISNASFGFDYKESMRPGANDISYALIMSDQLNSHLASKKEEAAKDAELMRLWKSIKNVAGKILTPGTTIADTFRVAQAKGDIGYATFTNTVADVIEEFLNTLVSQLIKNLQNGLFSGSGGNNNNSSFPDLSGLGALFNPNSGPIVTGIAGAKLAFSNLIEGQTKVGSKIDILLKLSQCPDSAKANPGPTDCVIDQKLLESIKNKRYVADLDQSVLNRPFAPQINQKASVETVISSRSVNILRKYRIVPVGWEFAAQAIKNSSTTESYTLGDVMNCFYGVGHTGCRAADDRFKGLIDPYWVLKAPETFCRRTGYTGLNTFAREQNSNIVRSESCVDEQQCLQEDEKGNCKSYGYCTQERRTWDIGKVCDSKYNTCVSYKSRNGLASNWLTNTLDFSSCTAQNAGCRSYATNFNYASLLINGDVITGNGVTRFSEFLGSSNVQTTFDPGWRVKENHTVSENRRLSLGTTCTKLSCDTINGCSWNDAGKYCTVTASCTIAAGGIGCYAENCYESASLISSKNSKFEEQAAGLNPGDAKSWTDELSYSDLNNRHYRVAGAGKSGFGLKVNSSNNTSDLITTLPDVTLEPGKNYRLKFSYKGTINQGSVIVKMIAGDSLYHFPNASISLGGQAFQVGSSIWTDVELPIINSGNYTTGTIAIVSPTGSIEDLTFDDFELNKMTDKCSAAGVLLYSAPTEVEQTAPSNIYFDRNVQTCSSNAVGCSQFIRTKAGLGNNLLYNGGLEYGLVGWSAQMNPVPQISNGAAIFDATAGSSAVVEVEPNAYYSFGFDAAQNATSTTYNVTAELDAFNTLSVSSLQSIAESNCTAISGNSATLVNQPADQNLARKSCYFKVPSDTHYLKFNFKSSAGTMRVDNIKLEKVAYPNFAATPYSVYDPSLGHSADQVAYINQAPDYFGCYKNEGGAWPTTAFELNDIMAKRSPQCSSFAGVCMQSEVGCELYKPINGDPEIPGVVDGLDLCPGECSGYQVYKQEATNFIASSSFKQFIADKNAKYCSAAYAGCDEFTNLDEVGQGGENKEYYVRFKVCQRPSPDDASYYTWEGSDITGYQLKAFNLKRSDITDAYNGNDGFAPCTNLFYNADGSNVCRDATTEGVCTQDDMPGNSDCRELYDVDGNVHYRLLSKTVTASDNCHPYRRTQTQTTVVSAQTDCESTHGWWKSLTSECIYMAIPKEGATCLADVAGCRAYTGNRGNNIRNILSSSNFNSATTSDNLWRDGSGNMDGIMISSEATYPGGNSLTNKVDAVDGSGISNPVIRHQVRLLKNRTYILSFWAKGNLSFNPSDISLKTNCNNASPNACADALPFSATRLAGENPLSPRVLITTDWQRYDLGPVFVTWDTTDNDYLSFTLPTGAKIYLDNIILKELGNNIYAVENSWYTPVSCDNKLDDADGKKAIADNTCQDESTGRCSTGEMLGCTAYKDRAQAVWYLRSFNSLCRREAVGCEALISTHNSESALPESFNVGDDMARVAGTQEYDQVSIPADNLVYLVNDQKTSCKATDKGCNAFGLPIIDKWDAVVGYQVVFLKNDPTRYSTDLCKHENLWCEEFTSRNSLTYFKEPHGKTCDYTSIASTSVGWFKTGTSEKCLPEEITGSLNGGSPNMTFGTGYEPASEKVQPLGPYSDVLGDYSNGGDNYLTNYEGWAGNCVAAADSCSEYVDPDPRIYTNYLSARDKGKPSVKLTLPAFALYNLTNVALTAMIAPSEAQPACRVFRPFGTASPLYYFEGTFSGDDCVIEIRAANWDSGSMLDPDTMKVSKAGVYYSLANSVDLSGCNGNVDFKSGCILMNSRNSIDYNRTSTIDRAIKYLVYDSVATYFTNNIAGGQSNPVSPQMPAAGRQADTNLIVKAGANRTCDKWLQCTTYQKTSDSSQDSRFDTQDQCLNFSVCDFRNTDGSCGRYEASDIANITNANFSPNMTGYTIPNRLPVAAMDQFGNSASVPNSNFESVLDGGLVGEPLGWIMNASSSDLNNDGYKAYKYAIEGQPQYLVFDTGYLTVNSVYSVTSEPIDVEKGYYTLDAWINTLELKPETATARIFIYSKTGVGNVVLPRETASSIRRVRVDGLDWITSDNLKLNSGNSWSEKKVLVQLLSKDSIKIRLMNFDDEDTLASSTSSTLNLDTIVTKLGPPNTTTTLSYHDCFDLVGGAPGKPNFTTPCNITGSSLFDNVALKSVLRVRNDSGAALDDLSNLPSTNELIPRSCRAFPAQDARSCQYVQDNGFYYGWYGYCLMVDPDNQSQCLQWYPVDQLKGDVASEYSAGYSDRVPLFYCAEVQRHTVGAQARYNGVGIGGSIINAVAQAIPGVAEVVSSILGESGKAIPFALSDPAVVRLFRYPMVTQFGVSALTLGAGIEGDAYGFGFMLYMGTMEKYYSCFNFSPGKNCPHKPSPIDLTGANANASTTVPGTDLNFPLGDLLVGAIEAVAGTAGISLDTILGNRLTQNSVWGGWGDVVSAIIPIGNGMFIGVGLPLASWDLVEDKIMNASTGGGSALNALLQALNIGGGSGDVQGEGTAMGGKIVTDEDQKYASKFVDPNPDVPGNILGAVYGVALGSKAGLDISFFQAGREFDTYYCSKFVQVATASGLNKAWVNRASQASQFTFLPGDKVSGIGSYTQICRTGLNPGETTTTPFFSNPYCLALAGSLEDIDPLTLGYQFDGYAADYKPFGAMVPPQTDLQNPYLWDSYSIVNTTDLSRQPLYWEPPVLSQGEPYQARMGQPVLPDGIKNLFAQSYGAWEWVPTDATPANSAKAGAYRPINENDPTYATYNWGTPTLYCNITDPDWYNSIYKTNGHVRGMNDRSHYCLIPPEIISMNVNSSTADLILDTENAARLNFTVRVDRDQLPLTSYLVEWGDGDLNNTAVTGVKLRARTNPENPFTLYHLYEKQKVLNAAINDECGSVVPTANPLDGFSTNPSNGCYLHYCTQSGNCYVRVRVTVTDNWRAEGSKVLEYIITVE